MVIVKKDFYDLVTFNILNYDMKSN